MKEYKKSTVVISTFLILLAIHCICYTCIIISKLASYILTGTPIHNLASNINMILLDTVLFPACVLIMVNTDEQFAEEILERSDNSDV